MKISYAKSRAMYKTKLKTKFGRHGGKRMTNCIYKWYRLYVWKYIFYDIEYINNRWVCMPLYRWLNWYPYPYSGVPHSRRLCYCYLVSLYILLCMRSLFVRMLSRFTTHPATRQCVDTLGLTNHSFPHSYKLICIFLCLCPAHYSPALFAYLLFWYYYMFIYFFCRIQTYRTKLEHSEERRRCPTGKMLCH